MLNNFNNKLKMKEVNFIKNINISLEKNNVKITDKTKNEKFADYKNNLNNEKEKNSINIENVNFNKLNKCEIAKNNINIFNNQQKKNEETNVSFEHFSDYKKIINQTNLADTGFNGESRTELKKSNQNYSTEFENINLDINYQKKNDDIAKFCPQININNFPKIQNKSLKFNILTIIGNKELSKQFEKNITYSSNPKTSNNFLDKNKNNSIVNKEKENVKKDEDKTLLKFAVYETHDLGEEIKILKNMIQSIKEIDEN